MPSPKNTTRTMAEVRAECAALGITPGRSIAECEARLADYKAKNDPPAAALHDAVTHGTGIMQVTTPGNERHVKFAEFAKAAEAEAPENITPEEEAAMRDYSAEQRRMDEIGETAWLAEQFKPCACGGECTGETGCTQQPAKLAHADYAEIEARALVLDESHYAKLARHGSAHRSGATPFKGGYITEVDAAGARKIVGEYREAYSPGMDVLMRECDVVMEVKRGFDTPKPKDQVRRDVRRKMRKATRQAQRRARG